MKGLIGFSLIFATLAAVSSRGVMESNFWAVLVAGSNGWENYRHQADVFHAYQILLKKGVPADRIILLAYDDIANNIENTKKGVVINQPNGTNVYEGVKIDYKGADVNPSTFMAVLRGDKNAVKGKGTGRVLESGPNDHVFINFADHGAEGIIAFPADLLAADDLLKTFKEMKKNDRYGELVFYLEACESGSMFDNLIDHYDNILVVTASAPDESSYAWYCESEIGTCLGDLFSIAWMERLESLNVSETIFEEFDAVRTRTVVRSHVNMYGDYRLGFTQFGGRGLSSTNKAEITTQNEEGGVNNRDVPLHSAQRRLRMLQDEANVKKDADLQIRIEKQKTFLQNLFQGRSYADTLMLLISKALSAGDPVLQGILDYTKQPITLDIFPCYKKLIAAFNENCFNVNKNYYFMKHLYRFSNYCSKGGDVTFGESAIRSTCQRVSFTPPIDII